MRTITYLQAITEAIDEEMARDKSVFVMGEDVRKWGAPFGEFAGLYDKYGERIRDTGISETAMAGAAAGAAATGTRPIVHIMFAEFLGVIMSDIRCVLTKTRYMTGAKTKFPATFLTYNGAGLSAAGEHSSCFFGPLMNTPGLRMIVPSTTADAKGLIKTAIREDNLTQVHYHLSMITSGLKGDVPDEDFTIPLGKADIKKEGKDVTIVGISAMVHKALAAAAALEKDGISAEVVDPRTLLPLDNETILKSVAKTGRLVVIDEEAKTGSAAAEIAAVVAEEGFDLLKKPIKRVCAPNTPIPFAPVLEKAWIPSEDSLIKAVKEIM